MNGLVLLSLLLACSTAFSQQDGEDTGAPDDAQAVKSAPITGDGATPVGVTKGASDKSEKSAPSPGSGSGSGSAFQSRPSAEKKGLAACPANSKPRKVDLLAAAYPWSTNQDENTRACHPDPIEGICYQTPVFGMQWGDGYGKEFQIATIGGFVNTNGSLSIVQGFEGRMMLSGREDRADVQTAELEVRSFSCPEVDYVMTVWIDDVEGESRPARWPCGMKTKVRRSSADVLHFGLEQAPDSCNLNDFAGHHVWFHFRADDCGGPSFRCNFTTREHVPGFVIP